MEGMTQHLSAEMEFPLKLLLFHFTSTHFFLRPGMLYLFIIPHFLSFWADRVSQGWPDVIFWSTIVFTKAATLESCGLWCGIQLTFTLSVYWSTQWTEFWSSRTLECLRWKWHKKMWKRLISAKACFSYKHTGMFISI